MTVGRAALAFTVSGLVLAGIAVLADRRPVTWVAIVFLCVAFLLRRIARRRGSP